MYVHENYRTVRTISGFCAMALVLEVCIFFKAQGEYEVRSKENFFDLQFFKIQLKLLQIQNLIT